MQVVNQENSPPQSRKRRFNAAEYQRMVEARILGEDDHVELVEGVIVETAPMGSRHAACVDRLNRYLNRLLSDEVMVRVRSPIRLDDTSEPEPDLTLLKPREDFYSKSILDPETCCW